MGKTTLERTSLSNFKAWNITNLLAKPQRLPKKPAFCMVRRNLKTVLAFKATKTMCKNIELV